jgi:hypothetical protein
MKATLSIIMNDGQITVNKIAILLNGSIDVIHGYIRILKYFSTYDCITDSYIIALINEYS